jgi:FkbM family methyltransferase
MLPAAKLLPINIFPLVLGDLLQKKINSGGSTADIFFVQIGAHDGLHVDPVRPYVKKYHWKGLLVEPQPEIYKRLVANYADEPQLAFENAAVARENGTTSLYTFKMDGILPDHATMLASFNRNALVYNGHEYKGEILELTVPTLTLDSLLTKHGVTNFDFLQIDTEGFDYEIIRMLESCSARPTVIHFESAFQNEVFKFKCGEALHRMGYRALTIGIDTIAYRQSEEDNFAEVFANRGYEVESA